MKRIAFYSSTYCLHVAIIDIQTGQKQQQQNISNVDLTYT